MNKIILVPTDFSKNADKALDYAIILAKKEKASIILVHAFHVPYIGPDEAMYAYAYLQEDVMKEAATKLDELSIKMAEEKLPFKIINKQGAAVDMILDIIRIKKPMLVVMGTKGASGIKEKLMGSNTAKVAEKSNCPVIAVPEKTIVDSITDITYATNYNTSDIAALKKIVEIGKALKATVTLLHCADGEFTQLCEIEYMNSFKKEVRKKIRYSKMQYKIEYGTDFITTLEKYIKKTSPAIIAMSTHHRSSVFDKLFYPSETKKMVYHTSVPLMVFHHKEKPIVSYYN